MRSCCVFNYPGLFHFLLLAVHLLSYRPVFPPGHQLLPPRCGGQIPCALPLMRTLAPLPSTTLSEEEGGGGGRCRWRGLVRDDIMGAGRWTHKPGISNVAGWGCILNKVVSGVGNEPTFHTSVVLNVVG